MPLPYYLILSHFIGDYLLQPHWLIRIKNKSPWGIVIHGIFIGLTMLVILIPYLYSPEIWYAIAAISILHIVIDYGKIEMRRQCPKMNVPVMYLIDQGLHLGVIFLIGFNGVAGIMPQTLPEPLMSWYRNPWLIHYVLMLVVVTYPYDVTRYVFRQTPLPYQRDYYGMILRGSLVSFVFLFGFILTR